MLGVRFRNHTRPAGQRGKSVGTTFELAWASPLSTTIADRRAILQTNPRQFKKRRYDGMYLKARETMGQSHVGRRTSPAFL